MNPSPRGEALAAATLAKLMGGELNMVDQMTVEQDPNKRANRINMDAFMAPLLNKPAPGQQPNFSYVDERLVQSMVPDVAIGSRPQAPDIIPMPPGYESKPQLPQNVLQVPVNQPLGPTRQIPPQPPITIGMDEVTKGNIASIANNLVLIRKDLLKVIGPFLSFLKRAEDQSTTRVDISNLTGMVSLIDEEALAEYKKTE